jgi:hypothetical protein
MRFIRHYLLLLPWRCSPAIFIQIPDKGSGYFTFNAGNTEYKVTKGSSEKLVQTEHLHVLRTVSNLTVSRHIESAASHLQHVPQLRQYQPTYMFSNTKIL